MLADAGVRIRATGPAIGPVGNNVFGFPIVGGKVNKKQLSGRILHSGGLAIKAGGTTLIVKRFIIDLDTGYLTAKVAGAGVHALRKRSAIQPRMQVSPERLNEERVPPYARWCPYLP